MARFRGVGRLCTFRDAEEVAPSRPMGPAWGEEPRRKDRTALNRSHGVRAAKAEGAARMATTQNRPIARSQMAAGARAQHLGFIEGIE